VVLHPEVSVMVTANVAQSAEEAAMQARGIDPLRLADEDDFDEDRTAPTAVQSSEASPQ
jgi:large subunit ribosomal protein L9